ncbi:DUF6415 family natural product biosynthesis protein [Streptomyces sp. NPDC052127]|uniref:DUF6415 family natural product biosynthesis protein n=1 Tax=Streptomyces sp. NPDC052127 TaxID=3155679 RepID=UPI00342E89CB
MAKSETTAPGGAESAAARPAPVDSDTIRGAYQTVLLSGSGALPTTPDVFAAQLTGHIQLLIPEIPVGRMRGEWLGTAHHVLARAHQLVDGDAATAPPTASRVWALATYCRALHSLYLHSRPGGPAAAGTRR